jgi:hypothetical protein
LCFLFALAGVLLCVAVAFPDLLGRALCGILFLFRVLASALVSTAHAYHLLSAIRLGFRKKSLSQLLSRQVSISGETLLVQKVVNPMASSLPSCKPQVFQHAQVLGDG